MIASYLPDAVASWSCLRLGGRVEVRVEDGQLRVAGGCGRLGGREHRRVVAVRHGEREIGDLEGLAGAEAAPALTRCRGLARSWARRPGGRRGRRAATRREDETDPEQAQQAFPPGPARLVRACVLLHRSGASSAAAECAEPVNTCQATLQDCGAVSIIRALPLSARTPRSDRHRNVTGPATVPFRPDLRGRTGCVAWMNTSALPRGSTDPPIDRTGVLR